MKKISKVYKVLSDGGVGGNMETVFIFLLIIIGLFFAEYLHGKEHFNQKNTRVIYKKSVGYMPQYKTILRWRDYSRLNNVNNTPQRVSFSSENMAFEFIRTKGSSYRIKR